MYILFSHGHTCEYIHLHMCILICIFVYKCIKMMYKNVPPKSSVDRESKMPHESIRSDGGLV